MKLIKKLLKYLLGKYYILIISNLKYSGGGLTKIPANHLSTISDLFLWRNDKTWTTIFELLDLYYLVNPIENKSGESISKLIFFDNSGKQIFDKEISYSKEGRNTINISEILPENINGYGTFACFHLNSNFHLNHCDSFFAERGYCGYSRNKNLNKSYVHGNLDAITFDKTNIEMLGNYNKRTYFYNLQYEFLPGFNYDIVLTNPTDKKQNIKLLFDNNHSLNEVIKIDPRGSIVKEIFFEDNIKVKLIVKSNIYMARPVIFKYHDDSLDVFHG